MKVPLSPPLSFILCYQVNKSSLAVTGDVGKMGNLRVQEIVGHKSPFWCLARAQLSAFMVGIKKNNDNQSTSWKKSRNSKSGLQPMSRQSHTIV